jgi:Predicted integral membrane protein
MISIEKSIFINKPTEQVFTFVTDASKAPSWQGSLEYVEGQASIVGQRHTEVRKLLGREVRTVVELTAYEPTAKWAVRVVKGLVPYEVIVLFESRDGGTRLTTQVRGEATGFFSAMEGMIKIQLEESIEEDMSRLKRILEA